MNTHKKKKIGDICEILNGFAFKSEEYVDKGIRIIRITNVQKGFIVDFDPKFYSFETKNQYSHYLLNEGDLLISLTGNMGRVGLISVDFLPAFLNQRVACLRPLNDIIINKKYLFHYLDNNNFERDCIDSSRGIAQKNMSTEWLKEYYILLPLLEEQKKIATILDKVSNLIILRKQQLEKLNLLVKSRFIEMFGDLVVNSKNWRICQLGTLGEFKNGMNFNKSDSGYKIKFLGVGDFKNKMVIKEEDLVQTINLSEKPNRGYLLEEGDIVFVRSNGSKELVGRSVLIGQFKEPITYSGFCIRFRNKSKNIIPEFLEQLFCDNNYKKTFKQDSEGININNINQQKLSKLEIILPPLNLQNQFADFIQQVEKQKSTLQQGLDKLELLKKALMQEYFG